MGERWNITEFTDWLRSLGINGKLSDKIAYEVSDKVHFEKIKAINDFKKRVSSMWETDYYDF